MKAEHGHFTENVMSTDNSANAEFHASTEFVSNAVSNVNAEIASNSVSIANPENVSTTEISFGDANPANTENVAVNEMTVNVPNSVSEANVTCVANTLTADDNVVADSGNVDPVHSVSHLVSAGPVDLQSSQTLVVSPASKTVSIRKRLTRFKKIVVYYCKVFVDYCIRNVKLLLGQMAGGTMAGLIVALFISLCYCPMIYYAYNSFMSYDAYLKPVDDETAPETFVKGSSTKNFIIAFSEKGAQMDLNEQSLENPIPNAPVTNKEFVYTIKSQDAKGAQKDLFSVVISDQTDKNSYLEKRALALNVYKLSSKTANEQPAQTPEKSAEQPAQAPEKSAEQPAQAPEKSAEQPAQAPEKSAEQPAQAPEKSAEQPAQAPETPAEQPVQTAGNPAEQPVQAAEDQNKQTIAYTPVLWNESANIAPSNLIFVLTSFMDIIKYPSYPTSISAFASWLQEYGIKSLELEKAKITGDDIAIISAALERKMDRQWRYQKKGDMSLLFSRCINGSIQFICFVLFTTTLILGLSRYIVIELCDPLKRLPESQCKLIKRDKRECKKLIGRFIKQYGLEPPTLVLWNDALNNQSSDVNNSLARTDDRIRKARATALEYVTFNMEAIPTCGFIGTIVGIGMTMMNVCSVIASDIARQQSRITDLSLDLAFAFDTTLLGLLLSLIIGFFIRVLEHSEQSSIDKNSNLIRDLKKV